MAFWEWLWTLLWFGGLALYAILATVIALRGGQDLRALLHDLREPRT